MAWRSRTKTSLIVGKKRGVKERELVPGLPGKESKPRIATTLPIALHKELLMAMNDPSQETPVTRRLSQKYWHLIEEFAKVFPELRNVPDKEVTEEQRTERTEQMLVRFRQMLTWCALHDPWALRSAHNVTASTAIKRFFDYARTPALADRPLVRTREQEVAALEGLGGKRVSDVR